MSAKTKDGRPASCFLVVEDAADTSTWHLPVKDADGTPNHTLMGAAWAALTGGYRGSKYQGPNKSAAMARLRALYRKEGMDVPKAKMAATPLPDQAPVPDPDNADLVIRSGLLFRAGEYPEQGFSITPDELKARASAFSGAPNELEHYHTDGRPSIVDGNLGELRAVWTNDEGTELHGDVVVPSWLDRLWAQAGRKVSLVFDPGTKDIVRNGLCLNPVIPDAAVKEAYAAFAAARHDTATGQYNIQMVHDAAARYGAVCSNANAKNRNMTPAFASSHESKALQQIHDIATEHGATCERMGQSTFAQPPQGGAQMQQQNTEDRLSTLDRVLRWISGEPPTQAPPAQGTVPPPAMTGITLPAPATFAQSDPTIMAKFAQLEGEVAKVKQDNEALRAQNTALQGGIDTEREARIQTEAVAIVNAFLQRGQLTPAEREYAIVQFAQAARDDAKPDSKVKFAVTKPDGTQAVEEKGRVQMLVESIAKRPSLMNMGDQLRATEQQGQNPQLPGALAAFAHWVTPASPAQQATDADGRYRGGVPSGMQVIDASAAASMSAALQAAAAGNPAAAQATATFAQPGRPQAGMSEERRRQLHSYTELGQQTMPGQQQQTATTK